jgi:hypothetical protein
VIGYPILLLKKTGFDAVYFLENSRCFGIEWLAKDIVELISVR